MLIMKKGLLVLMISGMLVGSCKKQETPPCPEVTDTGAASELPTLRAYITNNSIIATEHPKGFFYRIETAGSGNNPTPCSNITVAYVGKLTNGGTFDSNANASFNLGELISGWKLGIPLIANGGKIFLYLPPSLGYGPSPVNTIPGNSILIFEITLRAVR